MTRSGLLYLIATALVLGVAVGLAGHPTLGSVVTSVFTSAVLLVHHNPSGVFGAKAHKRCPHRQR